MRTDRIDLAYVALGTIFVFFGLVSCAIPLIRQRGEKRVLIWLGLWSGMYGVSLLLRTPSFSQVEPHWVSICAPFTIDAIRYLLVVVGMLVWAELTLGKMRRLSQWMAGIGLVIAIIGIASFIVTRSSAWILPYNNLLVVFALVSLAAVAAVPKLSSRFLAFSNPILTVATLFFTADALFRNVWGWLRLPAPELPLLDESAFALFLFSFAYAAGQKVFAKERKLLSIENELEIARQIQMSILPTSTPEIEHLRIAASYSPMTAVGGDFYEFLPMDARHAGFLVADVSGHGVPAALIAAMLKVAMQSVAECAHQPSEVLRVLNRTLSGQLRGQFITAAYLWLDMESRIASYSAAGHPPLLRWRPGTLERIESNGLLWGVLTDSEYPVRALTIEAGDRFLLYTDGMAEPENAAGEAFGESRLEQVLRDQQTQPPARLLASLLAEIRRWQPALTAQQDDITLIAIDVI